VAVLKDTQTGAEHPIEKRITLLGREDHCDIVLRSRLVSHEHARIRKRLFGYTIEDVGSTHGTYVNDKRLKRSKRLRNGDVIILAKAPVRPEKPVPPTEHPRDTSTGWEPHHTPAPGGLRRGDLRIGAELVFQA
jgi:hypothetical protein